MNSLLRMTIAMGLMTGVPAMAQDRGTTPATTLAGAPAQTPARGARPPAPTRDPHTPGYVAARELPDGAVPPLDAEGNFIIGPTHNPAPEMAANEAVPQGT